MPKRENYATLGVEVGLGLDNYFDKQLKSDNDIALLRREPDMLSCAYSAESQCGTQTCGAMEIINTLDEVDANDLAKFITPCTGPAGTVCEFRRMYPK